MDLVLQKKRMKKKARKQARKNESLNEQPRRCFTQVREEQRSKERMMGTPHFEEGRLKWNQPERDLEDGKG